MQISGTRKISIKKGWKETFRLNSDSASADILELSPGEQITATNFIKQIKNFIIHTDANLYLTNQRLGIVIGNRLTEVWFKDITKFELKPSSLGETIYVMSKFSSICLEYRNGNDAKIKPLRFYCVRRVIGGASGALNDETEKIYNLIKPHLSWYSSPNLPCS